MNFNYEKIKQRIEHGGNPWTSYSDLFLVLSVVFLLLYVVANLRSGAATLVTATAYREAMRENATLKDQIKSYDTVKDNYIAAENGSQDVAMYQNLMGHLDMLGQETKEEKERLQREAQDLNNKEAAIVNYQQVMKSIINANMVAQAKLKYRDLKLLEKDQVIDEQEKNINDLNQSVASKEAEVQKNNEQIAAINLQLSTKMAELDSAYKSKKQSKEKYEADLKKIQAESQSQLVVLQQKNQQAETQLQTAHANLEAAHNNIEEKNRELERLIVSANDKEKTYQSTIEGLEKEHQARLAQEREAYEKALKDTKLGDEEKLAKEQQKYMARVQAEKASYGSKLGELQGALASTEKNLHAMQSKYQGTVAALSKNLSDSQARQNERKAIANKIRDSLKSAGVDADVDGQTGEVTLRFANEYFDYNRADLKPGMRAQLEKLFPSYTAALFEDPKLAAIIASIDIIGYASPTFKGHAVDMDSLSSDDRLAVNYNMDLSYKRAKSIFEYAFDTNKMQFKYQKEILNKVHVTGRSYLAAAEEKKGGQRNPASSTSAQQYCQTYDCQKSQKVIIKFNLKDD